ncbi:nicotinamide riboside kinase 1 [Dermacentor andersoni]|uniref:nicotinamide riboside kinase 1 n=1 Tax=Dermacentor andersoni TaxID=34620 RepID=UPI002155A327|nr:nicotinamide riboside kinase 1-like [Dermacentor andersoni]
MLNNWTFVGVSGITNGGKTSLLKYLQKVIPDCVVLHQDDFFRSEFDENHVMIPELNHANWEALSSVDWEKMQDAITACTSQQPAGQKLMIIDGHIIFNHPRLAKLFDKRYFLTLTREECYARRLTRTYEPPDVPGYFEKVVWPMYLKNLQEVKDTQPDITYLDGTEDMDILHKKVLEDLQKFLKGRSDIHRSLNP